MLQPSARDGHELACGSCGAPLHEMKWLKSPKPHPTPRRQPTRFAAPKARPKRVKKEKRRKPLWMRGLEEAWDIIEDIID